MGRLANAILAGTLVVLLGAGPATAGGGNGLYEPFPKAALKRAKRFVERLPHPAAEPGKRFSEEELAHGRFVDLGAPVRRRGSASARAASAGGSSLGLPLELLVALLAAGALPALAALRRGRGAAGA
jgi:hypothetical protein